MTIQSRLSVLFLILLALAAALRLWGLDRDPPSYDLLRDEGPWTDEGTVALPAVEAVRSESFLSDPLVVSVRPIHEVILFVTFKFLGPGRLQGRLVSVILGVLGVGAVAGLGGMVWPRVGALLALTLAGTGFFFVIYDRLILTEGLLVALLSIVALAGIRARSAWGGVAVGIGLAVIAVGLKLHALALLPALVILYALRRRRLLSPFLLGAGSILLAWRVLWVSQFPQYPGYIGARLGSEQLGAPAPGQVVIQVILAGLPAYYLPYQIPLLLLASLEGLAFILSPRRWLREISDPILVALPWFLTVLVGAGLFRYMPTRYYHIASPALVILALAGAQRLWEGLAFPPASRRVCIGSALGLGLLLLFQVAPPLPIFGAWALWIPLLGLPLPLFFFWLTSRARPGWGWDKEYRFRIVVVLLLCNLVLQGGLYAVGVGQSRPDLPRAAADLAASLPADAILTGRLAGTMAILAPLRGVPALDWIALDYLEELAQEGPIWLVILEGDEKRVDPRVWSLLIWEGSFPVRYDQKARWLQVYRFDKRKENSQRNHANDALFVSFKAVR